MGTRSSRTHLNIVEVADVQPCRPQTLILALANSIVLASKQHSPNSTMANRARPAASARSCVCHLR